MLRPDQDTAGRARTLLGFGAFGTFWGAWGAVLPAVQSRAAVSDSRLGLALLCVGAGALLAMRFTGLAIDRWGHRVLPATLAAFAAAALLPAFARSAWALAGALLVLGAASGSVDVAINAEGVRAEARGRPTMQLAHATFSAAVVAASLLTGAVRSVGAGAPTVLAATAALLLAAAWVGRRGAGGPAVTPAAGPALSSLLRLPRALLVLGGLAALAYFVENAWQSWSAIHLETTFGQSAGVAALGPALFAASAVVGRLFGHRALARLSDRGLLIGGALVAAAGTLAGAVAGSALPALVGIAVAGLGSSVCAPSLMSLAGRGVSAGERGAAVSIVTTIGYLGFLVGPAAVGLAAGASSLTAALAGVAGVAALLAALAAFAPGRAAPDPKLSD